MSLLQIVEIGAVAASAVFGILMATRKHMDFVGLFAVGLATAFGGGTLRDLFLDRQPLFWIAHPEYPMLVFGLALMGAIVPNRLDALEKYVAIPDALGLGLFTIVGLQYAVAAQCHPFVAVLIGVLTGTCGSVVGEIICNEVPSLFRPAPLCATCAATGATLWLILNQLQVEGSVNSVISIAAIVLFRLAAIRWDLRLPAASGSRHG